MVNLLGNSPKQFMGLSDVNCWTISKHNSSDNFSINFYLNKYTKISLFGQPSNFICHALTPTVLGCLSAYEMHYAISI